MTLAASAPTTNESESLATDIHIRDRGSFSCARSGRRTRRASAGGQGARRRRTPDGRSGGPLAHQLPEEAQLTYRAWASDRHSSRRKLRCGAEALDRNPLLTNAPLRKAGVVSANEIPNCSLSHAARSQRRQRTTPWIAGSGSLTHNYRWCPLLLHHAWGHDPRQIRRNLLSSTGCLATGPAIPSGRRAGEVYIVGRYEFAERKGTVRCAALIAAFAGALLVATLARADIPPRCQPALNEAAMTAQTVADTYIAMANTLRVHKDGLLADGKALVAFSRANIACGKVVQRLIECIRGW